MARDVGSSTTRQNEPLFRDSNFEFDAVIGFAHTVQYVNLDSRRAPPDRPEPDATGTLAGNATSSDSVSTTAIRRESDPLSSFRPSSGKMTAVSSSDSSRVSAAAASNFGISTSASVGQLAQSASSAHPATSNSKARASPPPSLPASASASSSAGLASYSFSDVDEEEFESRIGAQSGTDEMVYFKDEVQDDDEQVDDEQDDEHGNRAAHADGWLPQNQDESLHGRIPRAARVDTRFNRGRSGFSHAQWNKPEFQQQLKDGEIKLRGNMGMCCELRCSEKCSLITTFRCEDCAPRGACHACFLERHPKGSTHTASWYCQASHVWKPWVNTRLFPQPWGCNCTDGLTHELDVISFTCTTRAKIWYCQHTPLLVALRLNELWPLTATTPQVAFEDSVLMLLKNVRFDRAQFPLPNYAYLKALGCADRFNVSEFTESFLRFCFLQKEMRQCQFISADEIQRRLASLSSSASNSEMPVQQQQPHQGDLAEPACSGGGIGFRARRERSVRRTEHFIPSNCLPGMSRASTAWGDQWTCSRCDSS